MLYRENGQFKTTYNNDQQIFPILQDRAAIALIMAFAFLAVPFLASEYMFRAILIPFLILSLAALGLNVLVGYCGQISLGTGGFMAVGAYAAYNLLVRIDGMPLIVAILFGGCVATVIGVLFGIPSLRIKGLYLAVATLAAHQVLHQEREDRHEAQAEQILFRWCVDIPTEGIELRHAHRARIRVVGQELDAQESPIAEELRSHIGREWMAMRDMDVAASVIGIRPIYAKLTAFAVSSFIVGVAGALWAFVYLGSWEGAAFSIDRSFQLLFIIIIGGLGSIMGNFFGAAFIVITPIVLDNLPYWFGIPIDTALASHLTYMIFGSLIVFFLIVEPHGLARLWSIGKEKLRLWPFPH